jgi:hypothetical protein
VTGGAGGQISVPFTINHKYFDYSADCMWSAQVEQLAPLSLANLNASAVDISSSSQAGLIT